MLSDFIAHRIAAIFHFYCDHHTDQHFSITLSFFCCSLPPKNGSLVVSLLSFLDYPKNRCVNLRARHLYSAFHTFVVCWAHVDLNANSLWIFADFHEFPRVFPAHFCSVAAVPRFPTFFWKTNMQNSHTWHSLLIWHRFNRIDYCASCMNCVHNSQFTL